MLSIFSYAYLLYVDVLGVSFYSGLLSIFNWVLVSLLLSCKNSLYVLITSSLSDMYFANIS